MDVKLLKPREKNLGGFTVRRMLPVKEQKMVGPWIFFDHIGPANFAQGEGINVRPHPHINLATVTYLFDGEIFHRDSLGNQQSIYPGDINLMVAGKGIAHSERERPEVKNSNHKLHGLQLWHALPEEFEEVDPEFHHYPKKLMPKLTVNDVSIRVMIGEGYGFKSPVKTFMKTFYAEALIPKDSVLELPQLEEIAVYVVSGNIQIEDKSILTHQMAILNSQLNEIKATSDAQIAVIGGDYLGDRHIEWNFVSSRKERIEQAKQDWKNGVFPKVPGDSEEYIPLPD
ncbi:pirin family protein [Thiotrichales bacterium 19S9-12]|nr:pirin family protein [Thiotrichales bacterium 19S9-11]MCF6812392.1 pirin family protein [Thiotrichales bacterium 19S9-12]